MIRKSIKIQEWASARYSPPPSLWVLRRWARDGEIHPMPEKVGKHYYVREDARRITAPALSLVDRLGAA